MFTSINRTVFDIPLTWDRTRFEASRSKCQQARRLIEMSVNAQYNKQLKNVFYERLDIEKTTCESQQRVFTQERKVRVLDNLLDVAEQSLEDYFDQRMVTARLAIQEHCSAIQQILREENEHWKEIHTAIDQNLITSEDIHPAKNVEEDNSPGNIHTIDEVDEEEEEEQQQQHRSELLSNKTVTPILTQMIRKSRLQSTRPSTTAHILESKRERMSVMVSLQSARRTLPVVDTTFVVKLEDTPTTDSNHSDQNEIIPVATVPTPVADVAPIPSLPTAEVDITPSYSQPKLPARLYFSPTLLQDEDENEAIQPILSTIDQNQSTHGKPRVSHRRFGQTFLLDHVKTEETDKTQDAENIRPRISDEIPFMIQCDPTMLPDNESHHSEILEERSKSIVYTKRRTQDAPRKTEVDQPIHNTRRTARNAKVNKDIEPTRKRKQSISDDGINTTVALRKRKAIRPSTASPAPPAKKTRGRKKKEVEIPIREPSPLPIIDRSKHYSTRFSTRSHRFNNRTLSTTEDENNHPKAKSSLRRVRKKSTARARGNDTDEDEQFLPKTRAKRTKTERNSTAKTAMVTRNRRK